MASRKQRADAAKKKEKRTKIFAIVGCVLLVAVGAYEIPSMLAVMNKKPPAATSAPSPSTGSGALPNVAVGSGTAPAAAQLASAGGATASPGQLLTFDVFETKNPFAPQVSDAAPEVATTLAAAAARPAAETAASTTPAAPTTVTVPATPPSAATAEPATSSATPPPSVTQTPPPSTSPTPGAPPTTTTTTTTPAPAQAAVAVKVNGVVSNVAAGGTFPSKAPVFRLVTWTKTTAQIAIVGGSYSTGDQTLNVKVGEPVTLENQTSGKRYTIELLSTG
jgi:hypothetical protein